MTTGLVREPSMGPQAGAEGTAVPGAGRVGRVVEARLAIAGLHDDACALSVEGALGLIPGVYAVRASCPDGTARVVFDSTRVRDWQFERAVRAMGYQLKSCEPVPVHAGGNARYAERSKPWNG